MKSSLQQRFSKIFAWIQLHILSTWIDREGRWVTEGLCYL